MLKTKWNLTKKQQLLLIAAIALISLAVVVTAVLSLVFSSGFLPRTTVSGVPCAGLTAEKAAQRIETAAGSVYFTLLDEQGETVAELPLAGLMDHAALTAQVQDLLDRQQSGLNLFGWMKWYGAAESVPLFSALTAEQLQEQIEAFYYEAAPLAEPVNARVELTDTGYELVAEDPGHELRGEVCAADALNVLAEQRKVEPVTAATETGVVRPRITAEGHICQYQVRQLDKYMNCPVSVDFGNGTVITLTPEEIFSICDVSLGEVAVSFVPDRERVAAKANELCDAYADDGVYAKFRNAAPTRELIYYRVGDKGWRLDREALTDGLCAAIAGHQTEPVQLTYDYTWYWLEQYPYNFHRDEQTFVEISLDNQYMWFYKDGVLLTETPVVTGCIANYDFTNRGFFRVAYKEADCFLVGPTWNDHVDYWIPFDGNIGLHDSSWRDEYGGDIYLENGSHGCVNTPLEPMGIIFNNIEGPVPVIVY